MINVLIIEDDEEMCEELREILESESYSVAVCNDGKQGVCSVEKNTYDIVLLDLKMPKMNGYEVLQQLKSKHSSPKVLILTGSPLLSKSSPRTEKESLNSGGDGNGVLKLADGVINKPFDVQQVLLTIKKLTERS